MNYYAQGGQAQGLKALAQELPKYGRYNDDMVAHISSDEARLLKSLGGAGTTNPATGLPEFGMFGIGGGGGILGTGINKGASDPVSNALSNNPISQGVSRGFQGAMGAVDQGLVGLDKAVGKTIPGGWGTVASVAGSAMGLPTPLMVGLGALNGSGVMRKGGKFNLQGAMMGGAMAYGMSELGEYARGAAEGVGGAADAVSKVTEEGLNAGSSVGASGINAATGEIGSGLAGNASGILPPPSIGSNIMAGNFGEAVSQIGSNIAEGATNAYNSGANFLDNATKLSTYGDAIDRGMTNAGNTASGIKNLVGLGEGTAKEAAKQAAATAAIEGTIKPGMAAGMTLYGGMGLQALDEQRKYLQDQANSGAISNAEYNTSLAEINRQADIARKTVSANPLRLSSGTEGIGEDPTLYAREEGNETLYDKNPYGGQTLYATGGAVNAPDDQTRMLGGSPMTNFLPKSQYTAPLAEENAAMQANQAAGIQTMGGLGGLISGRPTNNPSGVLSQTSAAQTMQSTASPQSLYGGSSALSGSNGNSNAFPLEGQYGIVKMAAGGMAPRFLSGGGDGMSDSIKATIGGTQEARLADGEFVIPADVVSHIGNGSSKAGAKQLYSMMDRVRQARVGNKKQGKQINPRKYLAA
jgi:hypothetical protein